jgi:hypothetical protein
MKYLLCITTICLFMMLSCSKENCKNNSSLKIGQVYGGGKIGYILASGDNGYDPCVTHGLIVADTIAGEGQLVFPWGIDTLYIGGTAKSIGSGANNTKEIIKKCTKPNIAAKYCDDFKVNGFDDWYLPSIDELEKIFTNKDSIGGFQRAMYWSSSESDTTNAYYMFFSVTGENKNNAGRVRPVRSF